MADNTGSRKDDIRQLLTSQYEAILEAAAKVGRRSYLSDDDIEDLASTFVTRELEGDSSSLSSFRGEAELSTYLCTVFNGLLIDSRRKRRGRHRPRKKTIGLGVAAERLEELIWRDGMSHHEAKETMISRGCPLTRDELDELIGHLQTTGRPTEVRVSTIMLVLPSDSRANETILNRDAARIADRVIELVEGFLESLPADQNLRFRMRLDGVSVSDIVRSCSLKRHAVDRELRHNREQLQRLLSESGITRADVESAIFLDCDLRFHDLDDRRGKRESGTD